jgi:NADH:ubiquinone oxidoreductase subunit C
VSTDSALDRAGELLGPWTSATSRPEPHRLDIAVAAADVVVAVRALRDAGWGYLAAITGLDLGAAAGGLDVLYHFCAGAAIVTLRVRILRSNATVPSICDLVPSASFFERELSEMFGVTVTGTPDVSRLLLPDDWPDGVYPLRKDFGTGAPAGDPEEEPHHADPRPT